MTMTTASLNGRAQMGAWTTTSTRRRGRRRRTFTAEYKAEILAEYDALAEGLRASGVRSCAGRACTPRTSRSGASSRDAGAPRRVWRRKVGQAAPAEQVELERLRRQNERLEAELATHEDGVGDHGKSTRALGAALRERGHRAEVEAVIDDHFDELAEVTSTKRACALLGGHRATLLPPPPAARCWARRRRGRRRRTR